MDDLFQLIRSMTKAEKRHFRLFATRYKQEKTYLLLFDELNRQKIYNEERLQRLFCEGEYAGQLHVAKNYLYKMIMKSLRSFDRKASRREKVEELITDIGILYDRGLFKQARKLWKQADRIAEDLENPDLKLTLTQLRFQLSGKGVRQLERLEDIHQDRMEALRSLEEMFQYDYLQERIATICTASPHRSTRQQKEVTELIEHPLLSHPPDRSSWRIQGLYYMTLASAHYALGEYLQAVAMLLESKRLYTEESTRRMEYFSEYLCTVGNLITLSRQTRNYSQYEELIAELREISDTGFERETASANRSYSTCKETLYLAELQLETVRGNFDQAVALAPEIDHFLEHVPSYRYGIQRNQIRLLLAYSCFACGDMNRALCYLNDLLDGGEPKKGRSIYYSGRELELLIHYELGNDELLYSLERSLRTRLATYKLGGAYEARVLRFFRAVLSGAPVDWNPDSYDPSEQQLLFGTIDFPAWIESKRSGESFSQVVRREFLELYQERVSG